MPVLQGVTAAPSPTHQPSYASYPTSPQTQLHYSRPQYSYAPQSQQQPQPNSRNPSNSIVQQSMMQQQQQQQQQQQPPQPPAMPTTHTMPINASQLPAGSSNAGSSTASSSTLMPTTAAMLMREGPRDFTVIKAVGDGSFGTVCLADWKSPLPSGTMLSPMQHPTTRPEYVGKRLVAIKRMKKPFKAWADCMKLKELKSLLDIPHHPNIIPLYDAFLDPSSKELHFVFECMEGNLYQLTKSRKGRPLAGGLIATIFQQIILGLDHIHKHGYFHRDMKPENLLITTTGLDDYPAMKAGAPPERDVIVIVKLADFGLARETTSKPPYTEYVSTRWYRAPEVLLRSRDYSNPVDMWALGTILAELVNLKPLFPGESEVDQVLQICEVLGNPSSEYGKDSKGRVRGGGPWERGIRMAASVCFQWPKAQPIKFSSLFSSRVPMELIQCIEDLLRYDPAARATTLQCMEHPYFTQIAPRLQPIKSKPPIAVATKPPAQPQEQQQPAYAGPSAVDFTAQRETLPPSHSHMPAEARPAFGEGQTSTSPQRVPFYRPPQQPIAPDARTSEEMHWHYRSGPPQETGNYGALPHPSSMQPVESQSGGMPASYEARSGLLPSLAQDRRGQDVAPFQTGPHAQNDRKKGWGMAISSVFSGNSGQQSGYDSTPVGSRGPSFALSRPPHPSGQPAPAGFMPNEPQQHPTANESVPPLDPKKAKKEAEKAAKQAEKAKRMQQEKVARERARAVMQKRNQIMEASTIKEQVEWLSGSSPPGHPGHQSEKARGKQPLQGPVLSPSQSPLSSFTSGVSPGDSSSTPHTPYSPAGSGVYSPGIYSSQRQHFISSHVPVPPHLMEMRDKGRPISVQSYQTGDSDPGPQGRRQMAGYPNVLQRQSSASSLSSGLDIMAQQQHNPYAHQHRYYSNGGQYSGAGNSVDSLRSIPDGHPPSVLDPQLVSNMEKMTAAERQSGSVSPAPVVGYMIGSTRPPSLGRQAGGKTRSRASSIQRAGSASPLHHPIAPRFHPYGVSHPPPSSHSQSSTHSHLAMGGMQLPSLQLSLEDESRRARSHSNAGGGPRPSISGRRRSSLSQSRPTASRGSIGSNSAFLTDRTGAIAIQSPQANHGVQQQQQQQQHQHLASSNSSGERQTGSAHSAGTGQYVNPMWGGTFATGISSSPEGKHQLSMSAGAGGGAGFPLGQSNAASSDTRLPPFSSLMAAAEARDDVLEVDEEDAEMVMDDQYHSLGPRPSVHPATNYHR